MASKRRRKMTAIEGIRANLTSLAAMGSFFAYIIYVDNTSPTYLYVALAVGLGIGLLVFALFSVLFMRKTRVETTFDFDQAPISRQKAATDFEYEVAGIIHAMTGKRTAVVGGSGDGGIDIKVFDDKNQLVGIVQCKNINPNKTVYPAHIRDLNTVRHHHQVNTAYLVTTGRFSENSRELAQKLGVKLIDGATLKKMRAKLITRADSSQPSANAVAMRR